MAMDRVSLGFRGLGVCVGVCEGGYNGGCNGFGYCVYENASMLTFSDVYKMK